jgi:hypothetical protein
MGELLEGDWGDQDRHRQRPAEQLGLGSDRIDVDQDPRPDPPAAERGPVLAQRDLVGGAAGEVGVGTRIERLLREALEVSDVYRINRGYKAMIGMIRMATMFATLIIGLIAGPAVSL